LPAWNDKATVKDVFCRTLCVAGLLAFGGCGFRLAGSDSLPPILAHPYLLLKDPYTDFSRDLEHQLRVSGAALQRISEGASATVEVSRDQVERRTLAVTGATPTQGANIPTEYELTYTVTYSVQEPDKELLAPQTVSLSRAFSYNVNLQLAKENEADILRQNMAQELASIVMHRLTKLK
jgi:LPS-assembly lipoprotein